MGCCVSTHNNKTAPKHLPHPHNFPCVSKSPPRPEEEAVKEVLSETPKPKPTPRPDSPAREDDPAKSKILLLTPKKPISDPKVPARYPDPCATPEEISEVSEMFSYSESISTNTLKEDDDYSHLLSTKETASSGQRVFRSQGYNGNYLLHGQQQQHYKNNNQGRSPARRRPEPSPPRRKSPGPGQGGPRREMGGDNFNRRSQSPGVRANVGRSPSARRNGPSPGRVRMVSGPEERKKMEVNEEERRERKSEEWQGPKESLENPLVSLECFIFL